MTANNFIYQNQLTSDFDFNDDRNGVIVTGVIVTVSLNNDEAYKVPCYGNQF